MEIQDLKKIAIKNLKSIKTFFKELIKMPYFKSYIAASIVLIIIFVFLTFPFELIIKKSISDYKAKNKNTINNISTENLKFSIFSNLQFDNLSIDYKNNDKINIDNFVSTKMGVLSYLIGNNIDFDFKIKQVEYVTGTYEFKSKIDAKIDIELSKKNFPVNGTVDINLENVNIEKLKIQLFSFPSIPIKKIQTSFKFEKNNISILKFNFSGVELSGKLSGNISHSGNINSTRLNLLLVVNKSSNILKNYSEILKSVISGYDGGDLKIKLTGTLKNPQHKFVK